MIDNNIGTPHAFYESGEACGGRPADQQAFHSKRVQVRETEHPSSDRWVSLATVRNGPALTYRVGVVDGLNRYVEAPKDYPTPRRARHAANRLLSDWSDR